jgi:hypothetical protein
MPCSATTVIGTVVVPDPPVAPFNPFNGHGYECGCIPCLAFWDGPLGVMVYRHWRTDARYTRMPPTAGEIMREAAIAAARKRRRSPPPAGPPVKIRLRHEPEPPPF